MAPARQAFTQLFRTARSGDTAAPLPNFEEVKIALLRLGQFHRGDADTEHARIFVLADGFRRGRLGDAKFDVDLVAGFVRIFGDRRRKLGGIANLPISDLFVVYVDLHRLHRQIWQMNQAAHYYFQQEWPMSIPDRQGELRGSSFAPREFFLRLAPTRDPILLRSAALAKLNALTDHRGVSSSLTAPREEHYDCPHQSREKRPPDGKAL